MSVSDRGGAPVARTSDQQRLNELGYAQELKRKMSGFSNFAVSFTIISILSGCMTTYYLALAAGGGPTISIGWPLVGIMVLLVGLAMAEVCSSFPTAGGLYYWSAKLAKKNGAAWSWFTGWFNLVGQIAVTAAIDFGFAIFFGAWLSLMDSDFTATPRWTFFFYAAVLIIHALLNARGVNLVARLNDISVWWHLAGVALIVGALIVIPDQHQSASFVFSEFKNSTGWSFPGSGAYVFLIGLLLAQYTLTGYDASAHMTEETVDASVAGPRGIVRAIWVSVLAGWVLLLGLTFAIQDYDRALAGADASAVPPAQIFLDALGSNWARVLMFITLGAQFFCGAASMTANSRMIYAFSRDGAIPGSATWHQINPKTRTPTNSIWFATVAALLLGVPSLLRNPSGVPVVFGAIVSIAVIGLYVSYIIPVYLRLRAGESFQRGPWHLGKWSHLIGWISVIWVAFICLLFLLPPFAPVDKHNFNYTSVVLLVVIGAVTIWWLASARNWFTGPRVQGTPEELAEIEAELNALEAGTLTAAGAETARSRREA